MGYENTRFRTTIFLHIAQSLEPKAQYVDSLFIHKYTYAHLFIRLSRVNVNQVFSKTLQNFYFCNLATNRYLPLTKQQINWFSQQIHHYFKMRPFLVYRQYFFTLKRKCGLKIYDLMRIINNYVITKYNELYIIYIKIK